MRNKHRTARSDLRRCLGQIEERVAAIRRVLGDDSSVIDDNAGQLMAIECDMHNLAEIANHWARTWFKKGKL